MADRKTPCLAVIADVAKLAGVSVPTVSRVLTGAARVRPEKERLVLDAIAMSVISGLSDVGMRVPDDVSVVGFDDHPLAAMWSPALTTVRQDFGGLGARAFELLRGAMSGDVVRRSLSQLPELVVRESAGPPGHRSLTSAGAPARVESATPALNGGDSAERMDG
jgi:DNA-binding LacI/PurR family transcriptional regulator